MKDIQGTMLQYSMATNLSSYLQRAWGDYIDNISIGDVKGVIQEIIHVDDEHGAFWVGIGDNEEYVLATHKDLVVIGVFEDSLQIKKQFNNWSEIESLYKIFLDGDIDDVKAILQQ